MANITVTLDDIDKKRLSDFCKQIGISISGLFTMFTKAILRDVCAEGACLCGVFLPYKGGESIKFMKRCHSTFCRR